jgi:hypothetical protein
MEIKLAYLLFGLNNMYLLKRREERKGKKRKTLKPT